MQALCGLQGIFDLFNCKTPELESAYYIPGFEEEGSVGYCWKFKNRVTGRKIYDIFPYVNWFNGKRIK